MLVSAKTGAALRAQVEQLVYHLERHPEQELADICYSAAIGRSHFRERLAVVAGTKEEAREKALAFAAGEARAGVFRGQVNPARRPKVALLFTGQGSQYEAMGLQLYETQPVFRQALDKCDEILKGKLRRPVLEILYPSTGSSPIDDTEFAQPALFSLEWGLWELWKSWGLEPDAVMGHSLGEYVAATVAGVMSLEEGLSLVAERGRLMQALPRDGEMASVDGARAAVLRLLSGRENEVSIAAENGPDQLVLSGRTSAIKAIRSVLENEGAKTKGLEVSHAFHSALMEPVLEQFERSLAKVQLRSAGIALISNVTGNVATDEVATASYWLRHVRETVKFETGMRALAARGIGVFVEIGPHPTLLGMGAVCLPDGKSSMATLSSEAS